MRKLLTCITLLTTIVITSSFKNDTKDLKSLAGKWKIVEIQQIVFHANGSHTTQHTQISHGNIKEYKGLEFATTNANNKLILSGTWHLAEGKIAETIRQDYNNRLTGKLNILDYKLKKNTLTIEYPSNTSHTAFVKEIWKKIK